MTFDRVRWANDRLSYLIERNSDSTLARLVALIQQGAVKNQVEAAAKLGVTGQRVSAAGQEI